MRGSLIEQNHDAGVLVVGSDAAITTIQSSSITGNARAGVASFGSTIEMHATTVACNAIDLNGYDHEGYADSFEGSGWQCSSPPPADCAELGECSVESSDIEPPEKADPLPPPGQP